MRIEGLDHPVCFLTYVPVKRPGSNNVEILEGPAKRTGAAGSMMSVYFGDPDGNLIEVSNRLKTS